MAPAKQIIKSTRFGRARACKNQFLLSTIEHEGRELVIKTGPSHVPFGIDDKHDKRTIHLRPQQTHCLDFLNLVTKKAIDYAYEQQSVLFADPKKPRDLIADRVYPIVKQRDARYPPGIEVDVPDGFELDDVPRGATVETEVLVSRFWCNRQRFGVKLVLKKLEVLQVPTGFTECMIQDFE